MTYKFISALLAASVAISASSTALAKDPCQSLLCMAGMVQGSVKGNSQDGCASGVSDFMSIVKMHHGHMDYTATPGARQSYLNSCSGAGDNAALIGTIISKFGNATL